MTPRARLGAAVGAAGFQFQPKWDEHPSSLPTSAAPSPKTASRLQAKAVVPLDAPFKTQEVESSLAERAPKLKVRKTQHARNMEKGKQVEPLKSQPALELAALVGNVTAPEQEVSLLPHTEPESATSNTQSPSCPVEPPLSNGFPPDTSMHSNIVALSDSRPHNWPETSCCPESSAVLAAVAAQEEAKGTLEPVPHAGLSAQVAIDSGRESDEKHCHEHKWIRVSHGRFRVLKVRANKLISKVCRHSQCLRARSYLDQISKMTLNAVSHKSDIRYD